MDDFEDNDEIWWDDTEHDFDDLDDRDYFETYQDWREHVCDYPC